MYLDLKRVIQTKGIDEYKNGSRVLRHNLIEPSTNVQFYAVFVAEEDKVTFSINIGQSLSGHFISMSRDFSSRGPSNTVIGGYNELFDFTGIVNSSYNMNTLTNCEIQLVNKPRFGIFETDKKKYLDDTLNFAKKCYKIGIEWFLIFLKDNNL